MRIVRSCKAVALGLSALLVAAAAPATATASPAPASSVGPQNPAAQSGAAWLATQINAQGFVPSPTTPTKPDLSSTAEIPLALAAANVAPAAAQRAVGYLAAHVATYVTDGPDIPGAAAVLILDAHALGDDPHAFGGVDLVAKLLATQQTTGTDTGLFGTQSPTYNGTFRQGLSLAALAAVGVSHTSATNSAVTWLEAQQCPDGGWSSYEATEGCTVDPLTYTRPGPDTNSTALALEGLAAQGAMTPSIATSALGFLIGAQYPDGGWGYNPDTGTPTLASDPDSTALVIQGLIATGLSPTNAMFSNTTGTPVTYLESQQVTSGTSAGAFFFGSPATISLLATYQAVPALSGVADPFGPSGGSFWLAAADGGVFGLGHAGYYGSLPALGVHVDDVTALTPSPDGKGYLLFGRDGGAYAFGDATFEGSVPGLGVATDDVVGAASTPDGGGYWLVGSDGGVFGFGDASFFGSLPGMGIATHDIVAIVGTADGGGYWLVGTDGGVFAFGDARYAGSLPARHDAVTDIVGATGAPGGGGYLLIGADGATYAFGDATFAGSLPGEGVTVDDVVGAAYTPDGAGYGLAGSDGGVFTLGGATFPGSLAGTRLSAPVVAVAASPTRAT